MDSQREFSVYTGIVLMRVFQCFLLLCEGRFLVSLCNSAMLIEEIQ